MGVGDGGPKGVIGRGYRRRGSGGQKAHTKLRVPTRSPPPPELSSKISKKLGGGKGVKNLRVVGLGGTRRNRGDCGGTRGTRGD